MAAFHLFIEGVATTPGTDATQVATAVGARFGIDGGEIARRLAAGRFRVKGNVDYATACSFRIELERLGVRCAIVDAATNAIVTAPPPPASMAPAKPIAPAAPVVAAPTVAAVAPIAPIAAAATGQYQSGLAAAFGGGNMHVGDDAMGALATGAFRLTALDNNSDADDGDDVTTFDNLPPTPLDATPSPDALPPLTLLAPPPLSAAAPATARPAAAQPSSPNSNAAFAPPSEHGEGGEQALTLLVDVRAEKKQAAEEVATRAKSQMLAVATPAAPEVPDAAGAGAAVSSPQVTVRKALEAALAPNPRWAIGVLLAMLLGFAAAHAYAAGKERAAFAAVDARLAARQAAVVTPTEWDELDAYRATELAAKSTAQRNIAQSAAAVWLLLSLALGAAWHLAVPWPRVMQMIADRGGSKS